MNLSGVSPDPLGQVLRGAVGGGFDPSSIQAPQGQPAQPSAPATSGFSSLLPASNARYQEQDGKHKGAAGTARDILGYLGDFLLDKLGMPTLYSNSQRNRKEQAALAGMGESPQATADALSRLQSIDPARADKIRDQYIDNARLNANVSSTIEGRDARIANAKDKLQTDVLGRVAGYMNNLGSVPEDKRAEAYANARRLWTNSDTVKNNPELLAKVNELYPPDYDPNLISSSISASVPVATQWAQTIQKQGLAERGRIADQSNDTRRYGIDKGSADRRYGVDTQAETQNKNRASREKVAGDNNVVKRESIKTTQDRNAEIARANRAKEAMPKKGDIVTLPDGTKARIK